MEGDKNTFKILAEYIGYATEITMPMIGGVILGYLTDRYFKTLPWFTVGLTILGFTAGVVNAIRLTRKFK
jgi:F0F1-type ATP synthase assembly protein I